MAWVKGLVAESGSIEKVELVASSGSSELDESATKAVMKWKMIPASYKGRRISMWIFVPIIMRVGDESETERMTPVEAAAAKRVKLLAEEYKDELLRDLSLRYPSN